MRICTVDGCEERLVARGLCSGHYQSEKKAGRLAQHGRVMQPAATHCQWCGDAIKSPSQGKRYCDSVCRQRAAEHRARCSSWPECPHERLRYGRTSKPVLERLLNHIDQSAGPDGCWIWTGWTNERGYGLFRYWNGERQVGTGAHRAMYEAINGRIDAGALVLHGCDNPPCCNPRHLRLGSQLDNMADRIAHGAGYPRGAANPKAVHVPAEVEAAIRSEYVRQSRTYGQPALAARYGLTRTTVQRIVTNSNRWKKAA